MSHSPDAEPFIVAEWDAALLDAGVSGDDFYLLVCAGAPEDGRAFAGLIPEALVVTDAEQTDGLIRRPEEMEEANDPANIARRRIACFGGIKDDDPEAVAFLAALLRHEIEHGKQQVVLGRLAEDLSAFGEIVSDSMDRLGMGSYLDLRNSAPIELDANAASSAFVAMRHPAPIRAIAATDHHHLIDQVDQPGDPSTLVTFSEV